MNEFVFVIIATMLIISLFLHYEGKLSELVYVKSTFDHHEYLVRNRDDKEEAANILARINSKLVELIAFLKKKFPKDERVQLLHSRFRPRNIRESLSSSKNTSYSINKGEKIVFCLRRKNVPKEPLIKLNTLVFVAIHELGHVMSKSIGHTEEFWNNMRFLLRHAIDQKIYQEQNFKKNPEPYCGMKITDTPLKSTKLEVSKK